MALPFLVIILLFVSCNQPDEPITVEENRPLTEQATDHKAPEASVSNDGGGLVIRTGKTTPGELLGFAETLLGSPYKYAASNPDEGFDCSGFIYYVFTHFSIEVPRSSVDFTNVEKAIPLDQAKAGDLILFTGTDSTNPIVGHMGIISSVGPEVNFIHSSSGKANGVTITPLNNYYKGRFVKVIRIFSQNDEE